MPGRFLFRVGSVNGQRGRGMAWVWGTLSLGWDGAGKCRQGVCGEEEGETGNLKGRGWTFPEPREETASERSPGRSVTITSQRRMIPKASV